MKLLIVVSVKDEKKNRLPAVGFSIDSSRLWVPIYEDTYREAGEKERREKDKRNVWRTEAEMEELTSKPASRWSWSRLRPRPRPRPRSVDVVLLCSAWFSLLANGL